jgi:hypothetical protein
VGVPEPAEDQEQCTFENEENRSEQAFTPEKAADS